MENFRSVRDPFLSVMHYYIKVPFGADASTVLSSLQLHVENMRVPAA